MTTNLMDEINLWSAVGVPVFVAGNFVVIRFIFAPFFLWRGAIAERDTAKNQLAAVLEQKLEMYFDPEDKGCIKEGGAEGDYFILFRIAVKTTGIHAVENCRGFLTKIEIDGIVKHGGDNILLTFAPGEDPDATCKTIWPDIPVFLDVLDVNYNKVRSIRKSGGWPQHLPLMGDIFPCQGEYTLTIQVAGNGTPTVTEQFRLSVGASIKQMKFQKLPHAA